AKGVLDFDHETSSAMSDAVFWFPAMALQPGQYLSPNPATDFMLRLAQFRIAVASRQTDSALIIMDRTLELLPRFDHEELVKPSEVMAYSLFLNTINVPIPPRRSINMLARLMELEESDATLAGMANSFRGHDLRTIDMSGFSLVQVFFTF